MTRMPLSSPLMRNFALSKPVTVPASTPAKNPAKVARAGGQLRMSSEAVTAAPSVMDPSAVISGKLKMRKLR